MIISIGWNRLERDSSINNTVKIIQTTYMEEISSDVIHHIIEPPIIVVIVIVPYYRT